jgi:hypothetical protein
MRLLVIAAAALVLSACIVEAPTAGKKEATQAAPAAPPRDFPSGANFGDKVQLLSFRIDPGSGVTGASVRASAMLKVLAPLDGDYMIFVHVEDVDGKVDRINVDHAPVRGSLPTSQWAAGNTLRDDFEIPIPPGMPVRGLNVLLGFWDPKTDARLVVKNADQVRTDGNNRVYVAQFPVAQP